jgi:hypothetical protein
MSEFLHKHWTCGHYNTMQVRKPKKEQNFHAFVLIPRLRSNIFALDVNLAHCSFLHQGDESNIGEVHICKLYPRLCIGEGSENKLFQI